MLIRNVAGFPWGPELAPVPGSRLLPRATMDRKDQEVLMGQSAPDEPGRPLQGMAVVIVGSKRPAAF